MRRSNAVYKLILLDLEILGRLSAAVCYSLVLHHLSFIERGQARPFHGRNMNEYVLAAALRLDKPIALCR